MSPPSYFDSNSDLDNDSLISEEKDFQKWLTRSQKRISWEKFCQFWNNLWQKFKSTFCSCFSKSSSGQVKISFENPIYYENLLLPEDEFYSDPWDLGDD